MSEQRVVRGFWDYENHCVILLSNMGAVEIPYGTDVSILTNHSTGVGPLKGWMREALEEAIGVLEGMGMHGEQPLRPIIAAIAEILGEDHEK